MGPDVVNNNWGAGGQNFMRWAKANYTGIDTDVANLLMASTDPTRSMFCTNAASEYAPGLNFIGLAPTGVLVNAGTYFEMGINTGGALGNPAENTEILFQTQMRERIQDMRDWDPAGTAVANQVVFYNGSDFTTLPGTGGATYGQLTLATIPDTVLTPTAGPLVTNTWYKLEFSGGVAGTILSSPSGDFDDGASGPGSAQNRIHMVPNAVNPRYGSYRIHAEISGFVDGNDKSCEFTFARNDVVTPVTDQFRQGSAWHSDREHHVSITMLVNNFNPTDWFSVYCRNIENNDKINLRYLSFEVHGLI